MILFKYGSKKTNDFMKLYKGYTIVEILKILGEKKWKTTLSNLVDLENPN